jgi:hypothetical protein
MDEILDLEWEAFQNVKNEGGRADCQDNPTMFVIMRSAYFIAWSKEALESYLNDLRAAAEDGRNLMEEKYARMMESTAPEQFKKIAEFLEPLTEAKRALIDENVSMYLRWQEEMMRAYPKSRAGTRPLYSSEDSEYETSFETYMRGELASYSLKTLELYTKNNRRMFESGENAAVKCFKHIMFMYGHSLDDTISP